VEKRISGTIGNQSSMMFVFSPDGELVKELIYGLKQNLKNQPPEAK